MGIYYTQKYYFKSLFLKTSLFGVSIPFFPGGKLIGLILTLNLTCSTFKRFLKRNKLGLFLIHIGILVMLIGSGLTGILAKESRLIFHEGESKNYSEDAHKSEFVIIDPSSKESDTVFSFTDSLLKKNKKLTHPNLPFSIVIKETFTNAVILESTHASGTDFKISHGKSKNKKIYPLDELKQNDTKNNTTIVTEILKKNGQSLGRWLFSLAPSGIEKIIIDNKNYYLTIRPLRYYTSYALHLDNFEHKKYPGTNIPKDFASQVSILNKEELSRSVRIYMNHPLRYQGRTYYQASYGKQDTLSILQVVENPGWLFPYISCFIMTFGLIIHFGNLLYKNQSKNHYVKK